MFCSGRCPKFLAILAMIATALASGCTPEPAVKQYTIDKRMPAVLKNDTRLLGASIPNESSSWFFKLTGELAAIDSVADQVRTWAQSIAFSNGNPVLDLPENWIERPGTPNRYATIVIPVGELPLEMSISKFTTVGNWDSWVGDNVNRWRKQMGLKESVDRLAGAESLAPSDTSQEPAVWVDLTGELSGMSSGGPMAGGPIAGGTTKGASSGLESFPEPTRPPIYFQTPEGWTVGNVSAMRWAAFDIVNDDRKAELTVIPAGGDLRGNIDRWLGQIRPDGVPEEILNKVMEKATSVTVDSRDSQRFFLSGTGIPEQAIDVTIVPLSEGVSLFIKMTGDAETVIAQSDAIQQFLDSLKLKL
jgi:hypothetical protein